MIKWIKIECLKWQERRLLEEIDACEWFIERDPNNTDHCEALADMNARLIDVRLKLQKLSPI